MKIKSLYAVNFRNYERCSLQLSSMINVFYGQNAQGKTNLLEAIFYSAFGMSHRTSAEEEMLKMGADAMAVGVEYASFSGSHEVKIKKYRQHERWQKEILLDGARVRPKEHYGALNTVMFSPEDLQLVKGEPALRRRFFDMQIAQTDPVYYDLLLKYNRVLQQRNRLLKELRDNGGTPGDQSALWLPKGPGHEKTNRGRRGGSYCPQTFGGFGQAAGYCRRDLFIHYQGQRNAAGAL